MLIANPIYDVVFKRMMENERVAKFFIGAVLKQNVETLTVQPQEFTRTTTDKLAAIAVFRLDFIATIKTETGEYKKVLIEIQKAKNSVDVMRFRHYLAEQYKKADIIEGKKTILPITTIYILGFKLPEIEMPFVKVARHYEGPDDETITIKTKSDFAEKLTHDAFIVQVERISDRYQTKLDKLLSVFEQKNFMDDQQITKDYKHPIDLEEVKIMTDILHHSGTNPEERKQLEIEQEALRSINAAVEDSERERDEALKALKEKDEALKAKEKEKDEALKVIKEKDEALKEKDEALKKQEEIIAELMRSLNKKK